MGIFYTATAIWPEHNPFLDEHTVYVIVLAGTPTWVPAGTSGWGSTGSGCSS